ncbi:MAG TPA: type II toxin-antitoxin system RelE/ParE family toxin [Candidatus Paceibacterota bacterium]
MKITFDPRARDDLERIAEWIAKDNSRAALEMVARIETSVYRLAAPEFSHIGHSGRVSGTLEVVVRPYIIVYKLFARRHEIVILSVVHGAQNR